MVFKLKTICLQLYSSFKYKLIVSSDIRERAEISFHKPLKLHADWTIKLVKFPNVYSLKILTGATLGKLGVYLPFETRKLTFTSQHT